jgi:hypothetical protein
MSAKRMGCAAVAKEAAVRKRKLSQPKHLALKLTLIKTFGMNFYI